MAASPETAMQEQPADEDSHVQAQHTADNSPRRLEKAELFAEHNVSAEEVPPAAQENGDAENDEPPQQVAPEQHVLTETTAAEPEADRGLDTQQPPVQQESQADVPAENGHAVDTVDAEPEEQGELALEEAPVAVHEAEVEETTGHHTPRDTNDIDPFAEVQVSPAAPEVEQSQDAPVDSTSFALLGGIAAAIRRFGGGDKAKRNPPTGAEGTNGGEEEEEEAVRAKPLGRGGDTAPGVQRGSRTKTTEPSGPHRLDLHMFKPEEIASLQEYVESNGPYPKSAGRCFFLCAGCVCCVCFMGAFYDRRKVATDQYTLEATGTGAVRASTSANRHHSNPGPMRICLPGMNTAKDRDELAELLYVWSGARRV